MIEQLFQLIRHARVDLSNEKAAQENLAELFTQRGIEFEREVRLSNADIIDFLIGDIGIEVKMRGARKMDVFHQLTRYAKHDRVKSLILVSNLSMGLPKQIEGKDAYFVRLSEGWM